MITFQKRHVEWVQCIDRRPDHSGQFTLCFHHRRVQLCAVLAVELRGLHPGLSPSHLSPLKYGRRCVHLHDCRIGTREVRGLLSFSNPTLLHMVSLSDICN